jgi:hypothetical protein
LCWLIENLMTGVGDHWDIVPHLHESHFNQGAQMIRIDRKHVRFAVISRSVQRRSIARSINAGKLVHTGGLRCGTSGTGPLRSVNPLERRVHVLRTAFEIGRYVDSRATSPPAPSAVRPGALTRSRAPGRSTNRRQFLRRRLCLTFEGRRSILGNPPGNYPGGLRPNQNF